MRSAMDWCWAHRNGIERMAFLAALLWGVYVLQDVSHSIEDVAQNLLCLDDIARAIK